MVAILEVGAFISSLVVGRVGDIIGRRKTILYGSIIFLVGGALQTFATSMGMMMAARAGTASSMGIAHRCRGCGIFGLRGRAGHEEDIWRVLGECERSDSSWMAAREGVEAWRCLGTRGPVVALL